MKLSRESIMFGALPPNALAVLELFFVHEAQRGAKETGLSEEDVFAGLVELYEAGELNLTVEQVANGFRYQFSKCDPSDAPQMHSKAACGRA